MDKTGAKAPVSGAENAVANATVENVRAEANKAKVITDLEPEIIPVSIHAVKRLTTNGNSYLILSCTNFTTHRPLTITISDAMVEAFDLKDTFREGRYTSEGNPPIYMNIQAVYVPNDGRKYGYIGKDSEKNPVLKIYNNVGTYVFRNVGDPLNGKIIRDRESEAAAACFHLQGYMVEARGLFEATRNRVYVAGVSEDDDLYFARCYQIAKGDR